MCVARRSRKRPDVPPTRACAASTLSPQTRNCNSSIQPTPVPAQNQLCYCTTPLRHIYPVHYNTTLPAALSDTPHNASLR
ncbi:hypothetical protein BU24DRAFT_3983 [Aaosphaeria arxii CBS 175.79]|uniref:Uncharacterized protein n=1 Tax=Aaosphaeria arxii CBS 175.79 TaxID=1450172 RepID=A0A6A5Y5Y2_9PLEO|nr:uncharacterized protein BU24DRAFT_3983 [Aaosphaeria arxii CBS 175.79]KAF2020613.1 hypothetical protein BU24DRAFT_3983 [Aaosphaeria arxii CBS 175.79]